MGLPLRMNNLHAPTVPSGPSTSRGPNGTASHQTLGELQKLKTDLEAELSALGGVLDTHGVNMDTALLTRDGFPRSDIDVAQIRTTRARIIRLRNDYKEVMNKVEKCVHEQFAAMRDQGSELPVSAQTSQMADSEEETLEQPFARVNTVASGSPAETAGLKPGDQLRKFGYVNHANHDGLKKVAECVQQNEGIQELRLTLVPRRDWGGRGLLGCHILPL